MRTDLAAPATVGVHGRRAPTVQILATGLLGGLGLGSLARAWMRLISKDPEFTWGGTLFIVLGFAAFGLTQSLVAAARRSDLRRPALTVLRMIGVAGMLPLFVGAGALMFPTVVGGGLAVARRDWHRVVRGICLILAAGPVILVGNGLVDSFGWSARTIVGFATMLAVYTAIILATEFTFAPQTDGWRLSRWATIVFLLLVLLLVLFPLYIGGIE